MGRFARSWHIFKQSWSILMADKELMLLPIISGVCILIVLASFIVPIAVMNPAWVESQSEGVLAGVGLAIYILLFTVAFFFQAAVIAGATQRMSGADPTVGSALGAAWSRIGTIVVWGIVAGTVGWIIKSLQERSELLGKIIMGVIGVAWSLATFFMAPVIIMEGKGLRDSFDRSWSIFKQTWGETMIGSGGLGLLTFLAMLLLGGLVFVLANMGMLIVAIAVGAIGVLLMMVVGSTLQGIYIAALYRFATTGDSPQGFDASTLRGAFVNKGKSK